MAAETHAQAQPAAEAPQRKHFQVPSFLPPALAAIASNLMTTLPAHAEAGKIFDFNLTLPIMVTEFLLLMVFLDKFWFTPVGNNLDARDKYIRDKLSNVKGNSDDLERMQKEAESVTSKARQEAGELIAQARSESQGQQKKELASVKEKLDKELEQALSALAKEKDSTLGSLNAQVDKLAAEIMGRILPEGVKL
ncbi:hypothetical protein WJX73_008584 [Symbiochloris irregularis]|uniref:ATP synthase subunit b', chloroplastic n=1 Tax=Symbiochloris irregularis TaxID=706552 RepID=A0AAW1NIT3_9CHLO